VPETIAPTITGSQLVGESMAIHSPATLELDEIQATVLRQRPAPYFGTHILFRIENAQAGRAFLRRLTPHVDSAAGWWNPADAWLALGITYAGLEALGVPHDSLQSFPETFRAGMAARAPQLRDVGANNPKNWDFAYGTGQIHIGVSVFTNSEEERRATLAMARAQIEGFSGVSVVYMQDFGAQPGDLNPLGYKDGIDQPAIEGSGVDPLPVKVDQSKRASSFSVTPVRPAFRCQCRSRRFSVATAHMSDSGNIKLALARSIDSCARTVPPKKSVSYSPRNLSVVGVAARL
jgi:deferrochelatase/peroxidase EfeB